MVRALLGFGVALGICAACGSATESSLEASVEAETDASTVAEPEGATGTSSSSSSGGARPDDSGPADPDRADAAVQPEPQGPIQCGVQLPFGAAEPPPLPAYAGICPALAAYPAYTEIVSGGSSRRFLVVKPSVIGSDEKLPVVFSWHWLGGHPEAMVEQLGLVAATEQQRFIAVVPAPKDSETFRWPFTSELASDGRMNEEYTFFDDMLTCVAAALPVDLGCVSSIGVSAGALFTDQLVIGRSERLASFVSLSGGVGGLARPWATPAHKLPGVVLWGGPDDDYPKQLPIMQFDKLSQNLESGMSADGLGMIECVHNCGHTVPPFDTPSSGIRFEALYDFMLSHPYGLADGELAYPDGLPSTFPSWCALGRGNAVPRAELCP